MVSLTGLLPFDFGVPPVCRHVQIRCAVSPRSQCAVKINRCAVNPGGTPIQCAVEMGLPHFGGPRLVLKRNYFLLSEKEILYK